MCLVQSLCVSSYRSHPHTRYDISCVSYRSHPRTRRDISCTVQSLRVPSYRSHPHTRYDISRVSYRSHPHTIRDISCVQFKVHACRTIEVAVASNLAHKHTTFEEVLVGPRQHIRATKWTMDLGIVLFPFVFPRQLVCRCQL